MHPTYYTLANNCYIAFIFNLCIWQILLSKLTSRHTVHLINSCIPWEANACCTAWATAMQYWNACVCRWRRLWSCTSSCGSGWVWWWSGPAGRGSPLCGGCCGRHWAGWAVWSNSTPWTPKPCHGSSSWATSTWTRESGPTGCWRPPHDRWCESHRVRRTNTHINTLNEC